MTICTCYKGKVLKGTMWLVCCPNQNENPLPILSTVISTEFLLSSLHVSWCYPGTSLCYQGTEPRGLPFPFCIQCPGLFPMWQDWTNTKNNHSLPDAWSLIFEVATCIQKIFEPCQAQRSIGYLAPSNPLLSYLWNRDFSTTAYAHASKMVNIVLSYFLIGYFGKWLIQWNPRHHF